MGKTSSSRSLYRVGRIGTEFGDPQGELKLPQAGGHGASWCSASPNRAEEKEASQAVGFRLDGQD
jgi:hypothetical protein